MSPETAPKTKLCPTCGTRLAENAARCVVCGSEFSAKAEQKSQKAIRGSQMPVIRLSLPIAIILLLLMLGIGATGVFMGLKATNRVVEPTTVPSPTQTATITPSPTQTPTATETLTPTPLPPIEYTVKSGDYCSTIAAIFHTSIQSIILLNNLDVNCDIYPNQKLLIPQPTPTPLPAATNTLEPAAATRAACQTVIYTVQEHDSLSTIALNYGVSIEAIKEWNGMSTNEVFIGTDIIIPLCMRGGPTPGGPTPTPTAPPPYNAPNLLLPSDGYPFNLANDIVPLQWSSIGVLADNERYMVTVEDVTAGTGLRLIRYVTDTKFDVPVSFRPLEAVPHVMRWWVVVVRRTGTDENGNDIYTIAGEPSVQRVFTWSGAAPVATPTK